MSKPTEEGRAADTSLQASKASSMTHRTFSLMATAILLLSTSSPITQAETFRALNQGPKILWRSGYPGSHDRWYDDVTEAYEAFKAGMADDYPIIDQATGRVLVAVVEYKNFRPHPWNATINGKGQQWLADIVYRNDNGYGEITLVTQATLVVSTAAPVCPDNTKMASARVDFNDPPQEIFVCKSQIAIPDRAKNSCGWGNPIYPESGLKQQREVDYASPKGPLVFERTYRSDIGRFSTFADARWVDYSSGSLPEGCITASYQRPIVGSSNKVPDSWCFPFLSIGVPEYQLMGSTGQQTAFAFTDDANNPSPNANNSTRATRVMTSDGEVLWRVLKDDNYIEWYNAQGRLLKRGGSDGKSVVFTYSDSNTPASTAPTGGLVIGATDSWGRALQFTYNSAGKLATLTDPAGGVTRYTYDTTSPECATGRCARLVAVEYPDSSRRTYHWNEAAFNAGINQSNVLTGITDENLVRSSSFAYDGNGLAISTERARGVDKYIVSREPGSVVVTDSLGSTRKLNTLRVLDVAYSTGASQPAGSGCSASNSAIAYDANQNVASQDDFNDHRSCYGYDLSRNLETVRVEGLGNTAACNAVTASGATLPGNNRKVSTVWHPDWRLPIQLAEPGLLTSSIYNGQPDPFNGDAVARCAPSTGLLPDGKPIAVLCKQVEQATTDDDGHLGIAATLQTGVAMRVRSWTYDATGQVLSATGPRTDIDDTTTYSYYSDTAFTGVDPDAVGHTTGDLQSITNAAGHVTSFTQYDKAGRVRQSIDAKGITTDTAYTPRGWVASTVVTPPGGTPRTTNYSYDAAGQLKVVTQPDGGTVTYSYDPAHRLIGIKDTRGNEVAYTLDNAGNRTAEQIKDPSGVLQRSISRSFDALNRLQQVSGAAQ